MLDDAKPYLAYSRNAVWLILSAIGLSVIVLAGLLLHIATSQDRRSAEQIRHFVRVSMTEQEKALQRSLLDNADWGAAYTHLHLTTDVDWAYVKNNLGRSTLTDLGVDYVAVYAPDGRQTYGLVEGDLARDAMSALSGGLEDLIKRARQLSPREIADAVLTIDGVPVLAAAAIVSTGDDPSIEATGGPPSVLAFAKKLTPQALATLADLLHLDELALPAVASNQEAFLRTSDASTSFALRVSVPTPGRDMLMALIPWIMITALLFGVFLVFLAKQGIKVANLSHAAATALAASNLALEQQAHIDLVTDLPNRAVFLNRLRKNLILTPNPSHVLFLDLDRFKPVNDCYGHAAGDEVLREVGARLRKCVTTADFPARLGGDEFVILVEGRTDGEIAALCTTIIDAVSKNMFYAGHAFTIGVSIGIARISKPRDTIEAVLQRADAALYAAKAAGRTTYRFERTLIERAVA